MPGPAQEPSVYENKQTSWTRIIVHTKAWDIVIGQGRCKLVPSMASASKLCGTNFVIFAEHRGYNIAKFEHTCIWRSYERQNANTRKRLAAPTNYFDRKKSSTPHNRYAEVKQLLKLKFLRGDHWESI